MPFFIHVVVELDFDLWLIDSLHYRADLDPIVQCSSVSSSLSIREERVINKKHKLGKRVINNKHRWHTILYNWLELTMLDWD